MHASFYKKLRIRLKISQIWVFNFSYWFLKNSFQFLITMMFTSPVFVKISQRSFISSITVWIDNTQKKFLSKTLQEANENKVKIFSGLPSLNDVSQKIFTSTEVSWYLVSESWISYRECLVNNYPYYWCAVVSYITD